MLAMIKAISLFAVADGISRTPAQQPLQLLSNPISASKVIKYHDMVPSWKHDNNRLGQKLYTTADKSLVSVGERSTHITRINDLRV